MRHVNISSRNRWELFAIERKKEYNGYSMVVNFKDKENSIYVRELTLNFDSLTLKFLEGEGEHISLDLDRILSNFMVCAKDFTYDIPINELDSIVRRYKYLEPLKIEWDTAFYIFVLIKEYLDLFKRVYIEHRCLHCCTLGYESVYFTEKRV